jgi:hypothetical protein
MERLVLKLAHEASQWACSLGFPGVDFKLIPEEFPQEPDEMAQP